MSNLSNISITHTFATDVAATGKVDTGELDTQLGNLATDLNLHKAALDNITDGDNDLAAQSVGLTQLKPEVTVLLGSDLTPVAVSGSRGGNAALASLLTALASINIISDNTTG